jgi:hypothetical protein
MTPAPGRIRRFRDHWRARRDGKRDGVIGIPTAHEPSPPPALVEIAQRAAESLAELCRGIASDEATCRDRLHSAERDRRNAEEDVDLASRRVAATEERHDKQTDSFSMASPTERGPRIGKRVYAVAICAILIAEFPLNAIAFRLFGEAEVLTWVITASLAVTLVLCAHGLGTFLRQPHPSMAERRWVLVLIALPVLAIVAIALIRARYLAVAAELTGLDTLGPVVGSAAFLIINLLVYTGATMLSYLAHAPKDRAAEERAAQQQRMTLAQQELTFATRRVREQEARVSRTEVASEEALRSMRARADQIIAYYRGVMASYSKANMRARGNPEVPDALRTLPAIEVPEVLRELGRVEPVVPAAEPVRALPRVAEAGR